MGMFAALPALCVGNQTVVSFTMGSDWDFWCFLSHKPGHDVNSRIAGDLLALYHIYLSDWYLEDDTGL